MSKEFLDDLSEDSRPHARRYSGRFFIFEGDGMSVVEGPIEVDRLPPIGGDCGDEWDPAPLKQADIRI